MISRNLKDYDKIYVFVSGGIDSTYLYEKLKKFYHEKVIPVNCYNPLETNDTLNRIKQNDKSFLQFKSNSKKTTKDNVIDAFKKIPKALQDLNDGKTYNKKSAFGCCYQIKHKALEQCKELSYDKACFISGIKSADGQNRRIFLSQLRKGSFHSLEKKEPTFMLKHKNNGMIYFYPFRDFTHKEFPNIVLKRLRKKYPNLKHSGCFYCPVIFLFDIKENMLKYQASVKIANNLGIYEHFKTKRKYL